MPAPTYVSGLDIGQAADFTALAGLRRDAAPGAKATYHVVGLERWAKIPYVALPGTDRGVLENVRALFDRPPLAGSMLALDHTGVGRAVLDAFRAGRVKAAIFPVTITAGHAAHADGAELKVPKKDLVGVVQTLLSSGRLTIDPGLKLARLLVEELTNFRAKVTGHGNEIYGEWRDGHNDDCVLAVALACWLAERCPPFAPGSVSTGRPNMPFSSPPAGALGAGDFRNPPRW